MNTCTQCNGNGLPWANLCEDCYFNSAIEAEDGDYIRISDDEIRVHGQGWFKLCSAGWFPITKNAWTECNGCPRQLSEGVRCDHDNDCICNYSDALRCMY